MRVFILAALAAIASANPALLGSNKCTYGPSYWCSHIQHARECGAMEHCIRAVWNHNDQPVESSAKCEVCELGVTKARELLKDHATEAQIAEVLAKGCEVLPDQLKVQCQSLVKEYLPEILQLLASHLDPKAVCAAIGMCTQQLSEPVVREAVEMKTTTTKGPSDLCKDCEKLLEDVENLLKDNQTLARFEATLDVLCEQLGPLESECKELIANYMPVLINMLLSELNPDVACRMLGMCKSGNVKDAIEFRFKLLKLVKQIPMTNSIEGPQECEICKVIFAELQSLDRSAKVQKAIESFLYENFCDLFGQLKTQCQDLIRDYAPMLFEYLANELDPSVACKTFHMCSQAVGSDSRVTALTVVKADPVIMETQPQEKQSSKLHQSVGCVICTLVIKELKDVLKENSSRAAVTKALEEICSQLPSTITAECKAFVKEYEPAVIELLVKDIDAATICKFLGLCSRQTQGKIKAVRTSSSGECELCQFIMNYVDSLLKENSTVEEVKHLLEKVCNYLPEAYKQQCDQFVEEYINVLIELIAQGLDPDQICRELGLCGNSTVAHHIMKAISNQVEQAKTDNTLYYRNSGLYGCLQGPDVWCRDENTAARCGVQAVTYCRNHVWKR